MFYWKILLNSVNSQLIHSIFTSLWIFFHPQAQHVSHAFRPCSRHTDFSRQTALSFHTGLIWLAAQPCSGDRQLHLQELAQPFMPAAHGGGQQLPLWDLCKGQCCSFPASHGPHGLGEMQMSPQPVARAQGQLAKSIWAATPGSAHASACPGEVVLGQTPRLQSNRLNANKSDLNIEPEWLLPLLFKLLASPFSPPQPEARWNL